MVLSFPNKWRVESPDSEGLPRAAVEDFIGLVMKVATQALYRKSFIEAVQICHGCSSGGE